MDEAKPMQTEKPAAHRRLWPVISIIIIVILVAGAGVLAWLWKQSYDQNNKTQAQVTQLQAQLSDMTKKYNDAQAKLSTTPTPSAAACVSSISQSLKDNLSAAISSKNTAALQGYMASSVRVVYAASDKSSNDTPAQAIADLDYVNNNATGPWNFNLSATILDNYKAGFYGQYFQNLVYVGKSANNYVLSYGFDCSGKINLIFVSADASLLTQ